MNVNVISKGSSTPNSFYVAGCNNNNIVKECNHMSKDELLKGEVSGDGKVVDTSVPHQRLEELFIACKAVCGEIHPRLLLGKILFESRKLLNCVTTSIFIYETATANLLHISLADRENPDSIGVDNLANSSTLTHSHSQMSIAELAIYSQVPLVRWHPSEMYNKEVDEISILVVPIWNTLGTLLGCLKTVNKMDEAGTVCQFNKEDEVVLVYLSSLAGVSMSNAAIFKDALAGRDLADGLLKVLSCLRPDLGVQSALLELSVNAKKIMQVEHCNIYIIDRLTGQVLPISSDTAANPSPISFNEMDEDDPISRCVYESKTIVREYASKAEARFGFRNLFRSHSDLNYSLDGEVGRIRRTNRSGTPPCVDCVLSREGSADEKFTDEELGDNNNLANGKQNVIVVPLRAENQMTIGLFELQNKHNDEGFLVPFTENDIRVLEMFGCLVGPRVTQSDLGMNAIATPLTEAGRAADTFCIDRRRPSISKLAIQEESEELEEGSLYT